MQVIALLTRTATSVITGGLAGWGIASGHPWALVPALYWQSYLYTLMRISKHRANLAQNGMYLAIVRTYRLADRLGHLGRLVDDGDQVIDWEGIARDTRPEPRYGRYA